MGKNKKRMVTVLGVLALMGLLKIWRYPLSYKGSNPIKVLNTISYSRIDSLDPIDMNKNLIYTEIIKMFEPLIDFHPLKRPLELYPVLAEEMPHVSEDRCTYTFRLKKKIFYHENQCFGKKKTREVKAKDFVYAFKRFLDPHLPVRLGGGYIQSFNIKGAKEWQAKNRAKKKTDYNKAVEGLKALDPYTFQLQLEKPFSDLLVYLSGSFFAPIPQEAVDFYGVDISRNPVGTGPFRLVQFAPEGNKIVYEKNPHYHTLLFPSEASKEYQDLLKYAGKKLPLVDKVVTGIVEEVLPQRLLLEKGEVDLNKIDINYQGFLNNDGTMRAKLTQKKMKLRKQKSCKLRFLGFNLRKKPFKNNLKLRQAMSYAYNREVFCKRFGCGIFVPAQQFLSDVVEGGILSNTKVHLRYDLAKAKKLLAESGYPEGKGLPPIVLDLTDSIKEYGEMFQRMMRAIGIRVIVNVIPFVVLINKLQKGEHMMYLMSWTTSMPLASPMLEILSSASPSNYCGFQHEEFDGLYVKASHLAVGEERTKAIQRLNEIATLQVPLICSNYNSECYITNQWVRNFVYTGFTGPYLELVDIDLDLKKRCLK